MEASPYSGSGPALDSHAEPPDTSWQPTIGQQFQSVVVVIHTSLWKFCKLKTTMERYSLFIGSGSWISRNASANQSSERRT